MKPGKEDICLSLPEDSLRYKPVTMHNKESCYLLWFVLRGMKTLYALLFTPVF